MNNPTIILLLILTMVSCGKNSELEIDKSQFQNKTFSLHFESEPDTLFIEFQDSTHQIFGSLWQGKLPWRISHYENANFLVLDNRVIGIKKIGEDKFKCTGIELNNNTFEMNERHPKWTKEQLYGTWVEEKYIETDSTDFPPHPFQSGKGQLNWPPSYTIAKDKIKLDWYDQFESEIQINNSSEFIEMNLNNSVGLGVRENFWRIKYLSDSIMIIDKRVDNYLKSQGEEHFTDIKLIKKN